MKKSLLLLLIFSLALLTGCKKNDVVDDTEDELSLTGSVSTVFEFEYRFNNELIQYTVEVVSKDDELLFIDIDTVSYISPLYELNVELARLAFVLEAIQDAETNQPLCMEVISEGEGQDGVEKSCRLLPEEYPLVTLDMVDEASDFELLAIYSDTSDGWDYAYVNITLTNETHYDDYENKE